MGLAQSTAFSGGFSNPVFQSQMTFRHIMKAMAEPGLVIDCSSAIVPPDPLLPNAAAVLCTLCDADTSVFIDQNTPRNTTLADWVRFQTGAEVVTSENCDFAMIVDAQKMPTLDRFSVGTAEYPDRSTTLILQVQSMAGGPKLSLTGPGIETVRTFEALGLPEHFLMSWQNNHALFPRGVDVILTTEEAIVCLPRSTQIEQGVI